MNNYGRYNNKLNVVGNAIHNARINKKMSLEKLSNKLLLMDINISITSLHRIENDQRAVRDYELCAIAKILKVKVDDLLESFKKNLEQNLY